MFSSGLNLNGFSALFSLIDRNSVFSNGKYRIKPGTFVQKFIADNKVSFISRAENCSFCIFKLTFNLKWNMVFIGNLSRMRVT